MLHRCDECSGKLRPITSTVIAKDKSTKEIVIGDVYYWACEDCGCTFSSEIEEELCYYFNPENVRRDAINEHSSPKEYSFETIHEIRRRGQYD